MCRSKGIDAAFQAAQSPSPSAEPLHVVRLDTEDDDFQSELTRRAEMYLPSASP